MSNFQEKVTFIWDLADLLRGSYKRNEYQKVILPFTFLKRLNSLLKYSKKNVIENYNKYEKTDKNIESILMDVSMDKNGNILGFYNYSELDLNLILNDPENIEENLILYINCFSHNVKDIFKNFHITDHIHRLAHNNLLFLILKKFNDSKIDLGPDKVSNNEMRFIFEELINKFVRQANGEAGEHFTPSDVVKLTTKLLLINDDNVLKDNNDLIKIYDPACGLGKMLASVKKDITELNPSINVETYGQEINEETYALCKANTLIKGESLENFKGPSSTLSNDQFSNDYFDYMISNPPYGRQWKPDEEKVREEYERGYKGRFGAGLPRINDSQLLFLQHLISKMEKGKRSRIAIITNRSALSSGGPGSGESNIRKWIIKNDYLEAIISLPDQLFYNTGIMNYIWILTNKKSSKRVGRVQLIDSVPHYKKMERDIGNKRHYISKYDLEDIINSYNNFKENETTRIFDNEEFCYKQITIRYEMDNDLTSISHFNEKIPLKDDIDIFIDDNVLKRIPSAEIDMDKNKTGCEINFTEVFYRYIPPISINNKFPLKQIAKISSFRNFKEKEDLIIVPGNFSEEVFINSEFEPGGSSHNKNRRYTRFKLSKNEKILPQYVKIFLNSELGQYQRKLFSRSSLFNLIHEEGIKSIYIPLPDLETQKRIIDADQKINEWYNEASSVYERFKNKIFNYDDILEIISNFKFVEDNQERNPLYDTFLWPLATLYISATRGTADPIENTYQYFNLFEFIAAFNSIVLISALPDNVYQENKKNIWANYNDYEKVSFGNWVGLYRRLSQIFRKEEISLPFGLDFYKKISSGKILNILEPIPKKRNDSLHGNVLSQPLAEDLLLELKSHLKDVFEILRAYNKLKLIYIESIEDAKLIENNQYIFKFKVKILNGACYPFIHETIETSKHMELKSLYLYNSSTEERLKLKNELIKLIQCKECSLWSLYVYNRINRTKKKSEAIYKSYQTEKHEYKEPNAYLKDLIKFN